MPSKALFPMTNVSRLLKWYIELVIHVGDISYSKEAKGPRLWLIIQLLLAEDRDAKYDIRI